MAKPRNSNPAAARATVPRPRGGGAREIGALLPDVGGVAFRRFGFSRAALLGQWREVVGPVYARWSIPELIRFPRGEKIGGTLTIRVEGPFGVQLQHVAPQIIERANRILGHGAIVRLKLLQGDVPPPPERTTQPIEPAAIPVGNLEGVKDDGLRQALEDLARQLAAGSAVPKVG